MREGKPDRLPALAAELVRLKVDVIVTAGRNRDTRRQGSSDHGFPSSWRSIQILLGTGLIASLARPGGNITGLC